MPSIVPIQLSLLSAVVAETGPDADAPVRYVTDAPSLSLWQSFRAALAHCVELAPWLFAALALVAIGYILARVAARGVTQAGEKLGLQTVAERGGLAASMRQAGVRRSVPQVVGIVVFWLLMYLFVMAALNLLWPTAVADVTAQALAFVPRVLLAAVLLLMGLLLATFVKGAVATSAEALGVGFARQLALASYTLIVLMTTMAALEQLQIQLRSLEHILLIACAAIGVAFALSVGLGGREVVAGLLAGHYVRQRMHPGDQVTVAGYHGVIREVGPVATTIETEEGGLMRRHSIPNIRMLSEAVR